VNKTSLEPSSAWIGNSRRCAPKRTEIFASGTPALAPASIWRVVHLRLKGFALLSASSDPADRQLLPPNRPGVAEGQST